MKRIRTSIDLTDEQQKFIQSLPFGWKQQIYSSLTDMLMELVKELGVGSLGLIITKKVSIGNLIEKE